MLSLYNRVWKTEMAREKYLTSGKEIEKMGRGITRGLRYQQTAYNDKKWALDGGVHVSCQLYVNFMKWQCRMSLVLIFFHVTHGVLKGTKGSKVVK